MSPVNAILGDSREVLKGLADNSIDSCVCDPPYALTSIVKRFGGNNAAPAKSNGATGVYGRASSGFMGQKWDTGETAFDPAFWAEVLRVLKPGAHLFAFSGTRTYHRMVCAIEDAGFDVRDQFAWAFGSGFPKSHDISKAIDRARDDYEAICCVAMWLRPHVERIGFDAVTRHFGFKDETMARARWTSRSKPNVPRWEQWLALKDICGFGDDMDAEVWRLNGRKGTPGDAWDQREIIGQQQQGKLAVAPGQGADRSSITLDITTAATEAAKQWEGWGTAAKPAWEPICLARKPLSEGTVAANVLRWGTGALNIDGCRVGTDDTRSPTGSKALGLMNDDGWQPRTVIGGSACGRWPANLIHDGSDEVLAGFPETGASSTYTRTVIGQSHPGHMSRAAGTLDERSDVSGFGDSGSAARFFYCAKADADDRIGSKHPTVKPVDLMAYLVRLVTRKGGTVLDPFAGSGTTGEAAMREGCNAILIEREPTYYADIQNRMKLALAGPEERARAIVKASGKLESADSLPLFGRSE